MPQPTCGHAMQKPNGTCQNNNLHASLAMHPRCTDSQRSVKPRWSKHWHGRPRCSMSGRQVTSFFKMGSIKMVNDTHAHTSQQITQTNKIQPQQPFQQAALHTQQWPMSVKEPGSQTMHARNQPWQQSIGFQQSCRHPGHSSLCLHHQLAVSRSPRSPPHLTA